MIVVRQLLAAFLSLALVAPASAVSYGYDAVGNRKQKTSRLPGMPGGLLNYNANDQLATDAYDAKRRAQVRKRSPCLDSKTIPWPSSGTERKPRKQSKITALGWAK